MRISVIMPTHNRGPILARTLKDMASLEASGIEWELLVIDNASDDDTKQIVDQRRDGLPLTYFCEPTPGKNRANNLGIDHARGDIVVFTDDDVTPRRDWLQRILASANRWPDCRVFGGAVVPVFPSSVRRSLRESWFSNLVFAVHDLGDVERAYPPGMSPVGPNCWFRRSIFDEGTRYDIGIGPKGRQGRRRLSGSELELFSRLYENGEQLVYVPTAVVHHRIQPYQAKIRYLLRRSFSSGRGHVRIHGVGTTARQWRGIPRYMFRQVAESFVFCIFNMMRLKLKRSFEDLMRVAMWCGCMAECRRTSRNA